MNVYFDGSYTAKVNGGIRLHCNDYLLSYGVVIDGGQYENHELSGCIVSGMGSNGLHEVFAFGEAILWLSSHGVEPSEVAFIADDQTVIYGAQSYNAGWASASHQAQLFEIFDKLISRKILPANIVALAMPYIIGSRFIKVKGHDVCVNNNRCDYLAKAASRKHHEPSYKTVSYATWLKSACTHWFHKLQANVHQPAQFSGELAQ